MSIAKLSIYKDSEITRTYDCMSDYDFPLSEMVLQSVIYMLEVVSKEHIYAHMKMLRLNCFLLNLYSYDKALELCMQIWF